MSTPNQPSLPPKKPLGPKKGVPPKPPLVSKSLLGRPAPWVTPPSFNEPAPEPVFFDEPEFNQDADQNDNNQTNTNQSRPRDKQKNDIENTAEKTAERNEAVGVAEEQAAKTGARLEAKAAGQMAKQAAATASRAATAFFAENPYVWAGLALLLVIGIIVVGIIFYVSCAKAPAQLCGKSFHIGTNNDNSADRILVQQITTLTSGSLNLELLKKTLDSAEITLKQYNQTADTATSNSGNNKKIKELSSKGLTIIETIRTIITSQTNTQNQKTSNISLIPRAHAATKPPITLTEDTKKIQLNLKELAGIFDQIIGLEAPDIFGKTALPIATNDMSGKFDSGPHGTSFQHPGNIYHHNAYLSYSDPIDIGVKAEGAAIYAPFAGTVQATPSKGTRDERVIIISDTNRARALLAHVNALVTPGQKVTAGQKVATVKTVGFPHLHFELRIDGRNWNNDPVYQSGKANWDRMVNLLKQGNI